MQNYLKDLPLYFYHSEDEDETLISCMKLAKSQEKKVNVNTRGKEGMEIRLILFLHHWLNPVLQLDAAWQKCYPIMKVKFRCGTTGNLFPENPLWTYADFQIDQTGLWDNCFHCTHHPVSSLLVQIWISHIMGKFVSGNVSFYLDVCTSRKETDNKRIISQIYQSLKVTRVRAVFPDSNANLVTSAIMVPLHGSFVFK